MANVVKRIGYVPVSSGGAGGTATKFSRPFTFPTWTLVGSEYSITTLASSHLKGVNPSVIVYLDNGLSFEVVQTSISINALGDVTVSITATPDIRFSGKITII